MLNYEKDHTIILPPDQSEHLRKEYILFKDHSQKALNQNISQSTISLSTFLMTGFDKMSLNRLSQKYYYIIGFILLCICISTLFYNNVSRAKKLEKTQQLYQYYYDGESNFQKRLWDDAISEYNKVTELISDSLKRECKQNTNTSRPEYCNVCKNIEKAKDEKENLLIIEKSTHLMNESKDYTQAINNLSIIKQKKDSVYHKDVIEKITFAQNEIDRLNKLKQKSNLLMNQAFVEYISGQVEFSIDHLNELLKLELPKDASIITKANQLKQQIISVKGTYEEGYSYFRNQQYKNAFNRWSEIFKIDRDITGKKMSYYTNQIYKYYIEYKFIKARQAYSKKNYLEAYKLCHDVLGSYSDHHGCLEIIQNIKPKLNNK